jgi:hypothetical protein
MKLRTILACISVILWLLLIGLAQFGTDYFNKGKRSAYRGEVIEEPETYFAFVQRKTGLPSHIQIFYLAALAGSFQYFSMRKKYK